MKGSLVYAHVMVLQHWDSQAGEQGHAMCKVDVMMHESQMFSMHHGVNQAKV